MKQGYCLWSYQIYWHSHPPHKNLSIFRFAGKNYLFFILRIFMKKINKYLQLFKK